MQGPAHQVSRWRRALAVVAITAMLLGSQSVVAVYPDKPIRMIVTAAAKLKSAVIIDAEAVCQNADGVADFDMCLPSVA